MQPILSLIALGTLLILLQACAPTPPRPTPLPPEVAAGMAEAAALEANDDYRAAAELYQVLALDLQPPARQDLLLRAVEALLNAGEADAAAGLLATPGLQEPAPGLELRRRLLQARTKLAMQHPELALELLSTPLPDAVTADQRRQYHQLRADALAQLDQPLASALELIELDPWSATPESRLDNQLAILARLTEVPPTELLQPGPYQAEQAGWLELAAIMQDVADPPEKIQSRLNAWHLAHPGHPALAELPQAYFELLRASSYRPNQLAVLLPETGRFQWVAAALREGILAAYFDQPADERPQLRFYDSSDPERIWPIFQQAVADGAEMVLGPLAKGAVTQLATAGELEVPILTLNQIPPNSNPPSHFYQFSLSPEDEARQVAEHAWAKGYNVALALTPEGNWGQRIYRSFDQRWRELGGLIGDHQTYNPKDHDFSAPLRQLLDLDQSSARLKDMQRLLARNLEFEPRRRADGDFVFLAARPQPARALRPQLKFHHAAGLPVYATSHIFSGAPNPKQDLDLDGVSFVDMPWLFGYAGAPGQSQAQLQAALPGFNPQLARFYAMGMDSYNLIPELPGLRHDADSNMDANSGQIHMDEFNQLQRRLIRVRFVDGSPRPLMPTQAKPETSTTSPPVSR